METYSPSGLDLSEYLTAYRDAILWANCYGIGGDEAESVDGRDLDNPPSVDTSDALAFLDANADALSYACERYGATWAQHGTDFALSRNGHGAGFFDRGYGSVGDDLQAAARVFGEHIVFVEH